MRSIQTDHPLYRLWYLIKTRCYNASKHNFPFYQKKGIKMCAEWLNNKESFYNWALNNGWEKGLSIDRIDSNGDYSPNNCQFISLSDNSKKARKDNKKRTYSKLTIENVIEIKKNLSLGVLGTELAKIFSIHKTTIYKIKHNKRWKDVLIPCS